MLSEAMEIESKLRKPPPIERRPTMLKDFLRDDLSSCSASGFRSFPRRSCNTSVRNLLEMDLKTRNPKISTKLLRSRSRAASTTISAFQKASEAVLNVVKHLHFTSVKYPLSSKQRILPKSLSKKLKRSFTKKAETEKNEIRVVVKVKDIIRWRSFRDLVEEKQEPLDYTSSPIHTTTMTTTTSNSWSDSDFTLESLHSSSGSSEFSGENEIDECKKYLPDKKKIISKRRCDVVGEDSMEKGESQYEEKDQFSPVSVLDFPFEEDDETSSSFQLSLEKMKRTKQKLMQKIRRFESLAQLEPVDLEKRISSLELDDSLESPTNSYSISENDEDEEEEDEESIRAEEKAIELLKLIKQTNSEEESLKEATMDHLLMDFFRDEIMARNLTNPKGGNDFDNELLNVVRNWIDGDYGSLDWGVEESREVHIKEMEKGGRWKIFEEEQGEFALDIEVSVLGSLMDELLLDLLS